MGHEHNHKNLIEEISDQWRDILDNSSQPIYIYLDDSHKACNKKFASLLGYASPKEWSAVQESFPQAFVAEKSQETLVTTYQNALENLSGLVCKVAWKKKSGGIVETEVILVPVSYEGHIFALHFIKN